MSIKRNNSPGYFFFLSGENPELAFFELESITFTLDSKLSLTRTSDPRIITLTVEEALTRKKETLIVHRIMAQVTMVHSCCSIIFQNEFLKSAPDQFEGLVSGFQEGRKDDGLNPDTSFCVRTKRINDPSGILTKTQITQELSRFFGKTILENIVGTTI